MMPHASGLPRISIVVPNLNGARTLQTCLASLTGQGYPDLELVVIDGGSTDASVGVIRQFEHHLAYWTSEADGGQACALNKGFARVTGEVLGWLCSDDALAEGALHRVGEYFACHPETDLLVGAASMEYDAEAGRNRILRPKADAFQLLPAHNGFVQPSCYWRRSLAQRTPLIDESYHYAMDAELWCHFKTLGARAAFTPDVLGRFIQSGRNKTAVGGYAIGLELDRLYRRYSADRIPLSRWYRHLRYPFECRLRRDRGWLRLAALRCIQVAYVLAFIPFYGYKRVTRMSWPA